MRGRTNMAAGGGDNYEVFILNQDNFHSSSNGRFEIIAPKNIKTLLGFSAYYTYGANDRCLSLQFIDEQDSEFFYLDVNSRKLNFGYSIEGNKVIISHSQIGEITTVVSGGCCYIPA